MRQTMVVDKHFEIRATMKVLQLEATDFFKRLDPLFRDLVTTDNNIEHCKK
jgi:hypothetical protein